MPVKKSKESIDRISVQNPEKGVQDPSACSDCCASTDAKCCCTDSGSISCCGGNVITSACCG